MRFWRLLSLRSERKVARADEWGGLESRCGALRHRGFESHTFRQSLYCFARVFLRSGSAVAKALSAIRSTLPAAPGVELSTRFPMTCSVMFAIN